MPTRVDRYLSAQDLDRIGQAVQKAEMKSDGEIAVVITPDSRAWYQESAVLSATLALLCTLMVLFGSRQSGWGTSYQYGLALISGFIAFLVSFAILKATLSGPTMVGKNVWNKALQCFSQLAPTRAKTAVLIYVSLAEKQAAVMADLGIAEKVAPDYWSIPCDRILKGMEDNRYADGIIAAIEDIGGHLAVHFPRSADDTNELPNRPTIVD